MRLWSLHPKYLDTKGLVALWRETLLAKKVLEDSTRGYKNHPQLDRFRSAPHPLNAINFYLQHIWIEGDNREFNFDKTKFTEITDIEKINITTGQITYEKDHLLKKLELRDPKLFFELKNRNEFEIHPLFKLIEGDVEPWEKV